MAEESQGEQRPDIIRVYVGEEKFTPFSYHSFSIGGFSFSTTVRPGETEEEAFTRAWAFLQKMKQDKFKEARDDFYSRMKASMPKDEDGMQ